MYHKTDWIEIKIICFHDRNYISTHAYLFKWTTLPNYSSFLLSLPSCSTSFNETLMEEK